MMDRTLEPRGCLLDYTRTDLAPDFHYSKPFLQK